MLCLSWRTAPSPTACALPTTCASPQCPKFAVICVQSGLQLQRRRPALPLLHWHRLRPTRPGRADPGFNPPRGRVSRLAHRGVRAQWHERRRDDARVLGARRHAARWWCLQEVGGRGGGHLEGAPAGRCARAVQRRYARGGDECGAMCATSVILVGVLFVPQSTHGWLAQGCACCSCRTRGDSQTA